MRMRILLVMQLARPTRASRYLGGLRRSALEKFSAEGAVRL